MSNQEFAELDGPYEVDCDSYTDQEWIKKYLEEGYDNDDIDDIIGNALAGMNWYRIAEISALEMGLNYGEIGPAIARRITARLRDYMISAAKEAEGCYDPY
jgi:hypothetical protein